MNTIPRQSVMDASILMKFLLPEAESPFVRQMVRDLHDDEQAVIAVPDLLYIECANVIWKRIQRQEFDISTAEVLIGALAKLNLSVTPVTDLHARALHLACAFQITAYDACYLALAERLGMPLLIADARLAARIAGGAGDGHHAGVVDGDMKYPAPAPSSAGSGRCAGSGTNA